MELDEVIRRRHMCRSFRGDAVAPEVVDRVLERARRAPSAGHSQGWAFVVLEGAEQTSRFWRHAAEEDWLSHPDQPGLVAAPVIVVPLAGRAVYEARYAESDKTRAVPFGPAQWEIPYWLVDTAFATMLIFLGATAEGLGACFFALHGDTPALLAELGVPEGWRPLGAVAMGWPSPAAGPAQSGSAARGRRPVEEVVHRGGW
ncbi:MAG: nitroreductase family protein [Acidimicrobiales bacterium]